MNILQKEKVPEDPPAKLCPHKHYGSDLIAAVLDGDIMPEDTMNEDYPCDETIRRRHHWLMANFSRTEGYCPHGL